jgi:hypothetical protein
MQRVFKRFDGVTCLAKRRILFQALFDGAKALTLPFKVQVNRLEPVEGLGLTHGVSPMLAETAAQCTMRVRL